MVIQQDESKNLENNNFEEGDHAEHNNVNWMTLQCQMIPELLEDIIPDHLHKILDLERRVQNPFYHTTRPQDDSKLPDT